MSAMNSTLPLFLAGLFLSGCSPPERHSTATGDSASQAQNFSFADGTTMRVRERIGDTVRGIHIVRKTPAGGFDTIDAEKGRISDGTDKSVMRVTLYDAHVELSSKQRLTIDEMPLNLIKPLDARALEKIGRDLRQQRLTNQMRRTGR